MESGFIKIHRRALDSWLWTLPETQFKIAMTCLMMARWRDGSIYYKGKPKPVPRGSFVTSLESMAAKANTSKSTVKRTLQTLESFDFLTQEVTNKFRIISIVNYGAYQDASPKSGKQADTQVTSQVDTQVTTQVTTNRRKKEGKKGRSNSFAPPTVKEAADYFTERGCASVGEAERFIDYYESVGWIVGKSQKKMKDWKAAARGWVSRNAETQQPKKPYTSPVDPEENPGWW